VSTHYSETATSVTIGALKYRACCSEPGCPNLDRLGLRYADAGGTHNAAAWPSAQERIVDDRL